MDIVDFIDLKKNSGEERRRAHDLFPALWISDLFMERVISDSNWTLFDPSEVSDLSTLHSTEFKNRYEQYEIDTTKTKNVIKAKDLWKKILTSYFESGSPFLCFKDAANIVNPNKHIGFIRSSNLCFTGDTVVATADGRNGVTIKQLAEESKGVIKFPVYCAKEDNSRRIPKIINKRNKGWVKTTRWEDQIKNAVAFKTGTKKVITVVLENGDTFRCTPDHELALNGGGYVEAKDSIGKEIKSFYTKTNMGLKVTNIIDNGEVEDVYDLTVDDNHNFYIITSTDDDNYLNCNGILVHNCTEIFQNTNPNHYKIKIEFNDGSIRTFEENVEVLLDSGITKKANKITALDSIDGKEIFIVEKEKIDGDTAVCNLGSINLSKINTREDIERVVPIAVNMLDNVIDLNFYPLRKVKVTNLKTRAIGLGVMGEAEMLATNGIMWGTQEHYNKIDEIMEAISYNAISSSSDLAVEKGTYPNFKGSSWSKGIMPHDHTLEEVKQIVNRELHYDWNGLRAKVMDLGMRNGYLMAIAPTSSISILVGTTQAIEPIYKRKWYEENLSGLIPVVVPKLSPSTWPFYVSAFDVDQMSIIKAGAVRQKWIDQGQSLNIFMSIEKSSGRYLHEIYTTAWRLGLKSTYYLRSQSPEAKNDVEDRSMECTGCQ